MNMLTSLARWLCVGLTTLCAVSWITLSTLQATFFSKEAVSSWLAESNIYKNVFNDIVREGSSEVSDAQSIQVKPEVVRDALQQTFPEQYVQQQAETVIDSTYAWLKGGAETIAFTLPVHEKRAEFTQNLAKALEPEIAKLPACQAGSAPTTPCVPPGTQVTQLTQELTNQLVTDNRLLAEPFTEQTFAGTVQQVPPLQVTILRSLATWLPVATLLLPLGAVIFGTLSVWLTPHKLAGVQLVGRRVFFSAILPTLVGVAAWVLAPMLQLSAMSAPGADTRAVSELLDPLLQQALPSFGRTLTFYAGVVAACGLVLWLSAKRVRRAEQLRQLVSATDPRVVPTATITATNPPPINHPEQSKDSSVTPPNPKL